MFLNRLFRRQQQRLKSELHVFQTERNINISGKLSATYYTVNTLHIKERDGEQEINIANEQSGNAFTFSFHLSALQQMLSTMDKGILDFYLLVRVHENNLDKEERMRIGSRDTTRYDANEKTYTYPIRLGRFPMSHIQLHDTMTVEDRQCQFYITTRGNISLSINEPVEQPIKNQLNYFRTANNTLTFGGKIFSRSHLINELHVVLLGREHGTEASFPVTDVTHLERETNRRFGLNRYKYKVQFNLNELINDFINEDVYDVYLDLSLHDLPQPARVRISRPRFFARTNLKAAHARREDTVFIATPYYTFREKNLSLQVNTFAAHLYTYLRRMLRWSFFLRLFYRWKNIWIVGERIHKAQDTGYHFFNYMRTNYPDNNVYYVITKDSPEAKNVERLGNVIYHKSREHIKYTLVAKRIIGSHHPDYLYPLRTTEFAKKVKAKKVFLQHGVIGVKNMVANYGKQAAGFKTDLFLVSSEKEREIVINDFNYHPKEVVVTGLSRFDTLLTDDVKVKKQLLIIPTWREWLLREDRFLESDYFAEYKRLIHNDQLHQFAQEYNVEIILCLHPNMQRYSHHFEGAPVKIIQFGEVDVQLLLKQSAMMITDYSSVAFDFSFLDKPIIYYQFDRDRFIGKAGSHLDLANELPGDIAFTVEKVLELLTDYAQNDFVNKAENSKKAATFLTYNDLRSSERIYEAVTHKIRRKSLIEKIKETEFFKTLFTRFRKSPIYFPAMKRLYNVVRTIMPVNQKLFVFETGVGKYYADSPRAIYEEIVKRKLDYEIIWVSNESVRFTDTENTRRVERLSPSYYYYLARARVWVNNQNFPAYIKKRKETTYLQTWHGTPLKRMLYDLESVYGRTDGYLQRVSRAIWNWDYLISPSAYATKAFKSAFQFSGEILEVGYPRNDIFHFAGKETIIEQVRNRLNIQAGKKVILYAPTFRDNETTRGNRFVFDLKLDLEKMQQALGNEYVILLRMHMVVSNRLRLAESLEDFAMDVTSYPDMQELLLVADMLITDYSSTIFDYANTKRPMIFFTYDIDLYRDEVRGFYLDFEAEAPGPLVTTTEEIIDNIDNIEEMQEQFREKYIAFHANYCYLDDGKASERVVDFFIKEEIL